MTICARDHDGPHLTGRTIPRTARNDHPRWGATYASRFPRYVHSTRSFRNRREHVIEAIEFQWWVLIEAHWLGRLQRPHVHVHTACQRTLYTGHLQFGQDPDPAFPMCPTCVKWQARKKEASDGADQDYQRGPDGG